MQVVSPDSPQPRTFDSQDFRIVSMKIDVDCVPTPQQVVIRKRFMEAYESCSSLVERKRLYKKLMREVEKSRFQNQWEEGVSEIGASNVWMSRP